MRSVIGGTVAEVDRVDVPSYERSYNLNLSECLQTSLQQFL